MSDKKTVFAETIQPVCIEFLEPARYADIPKGQTFEGYSERGFFYFQHNGRPARLPERFFKILSDEKESKKAKTEKR